MGGVFAAACAAFAFGALGCGGGGAGAKNATSAQPDSHTRLPIPLKTTKFTLSNGLEVYVDEDHRSPVVALDLVYEVGSRDDPAQRSGFAHLFEHLMFDGSKHVKKGEHQRMLDAAGVREQNATTQYDRTRYYETVPSSAIELALWLEAERMQYLPDGLDQTAFETERNVVLNERRQRVDNVPGGHVSEILASYVFPDGHPYNHSTIGTPEDLAAAKLDEVRAFFKKFYSPGNAKLYLVGDIDQKTAADLVLKTFGNVPAAPLPKRDTEAPEIAIPAKTIDVAANVEFPEVHLSWPAPAAFSADEVALATVLGFVRGRLNRWLIDDRKIARSVNSYYERSQLGGRAGIDIVCQKGASFDEVLSVVENMINETPYSRMYADDVDYRRGASMSGIVYDLEDFDDRADSYAWSREMTGSTMSVVKRIGDYDAVRVQDARTAKAKYLSDATRITALVRPSKNAPIAGEIAKVH
jgi:predicted Zn-dependent peptidase